jgi:hypothetical protein
MRMFHLTSHTISSHMCHSSQIQPLIRGFQYPKYNRFCRFGDALAYLIWKGEKGFDRAANVCPPLPRTPRPVPRSSAAPTSPRAANPADSTAIQAQIPSEYDIELLTALTERLSSIGSGSLQSSAGRYIYLSHLCVS